MGEEGERRVMRWYGRRRGMGGDRVCGETVGTMCP